MRKVVKNISLVLLMVSISSAIANWGNGLTEDPVTVTIAFFASLLAYVFADTFED